MDRLCCILLVVMATVASIFPLSEGGRADGCRYYRRACQYKGKKYEFADVWKTKNCWDCSCTGFNGFGYRCCQNYWMPMIFDEEQCEAVWDAKACSYSVVRKDDSGETCEIFAGVLK